MAIALITAGTVIFMIFIPSEEKSFLMKVSPHFDF